jgi:aspartate kinase
VWNIEFQLVVLVFWQLQILERFFFRMNVNSRLLMHICTMQVMKFGGASVKNAVAVRNVASIIRKFAPEDRLVVVISAMDKTTNHLEQLAWFARDQREVDTWQQYDRIRAFHFDLVSELFGANGGEVKGELDRFFQEIQRVIQGILLLGEFPPRTYDRIVAYGELISASILSHFLRKEGLRVACPDAREIIRTDARFTQAQVIWNVTQENILSQVLPLFDQVQVVVVQGFIASSLDGKVTTLGREGSDYTASIFAACLQAQSLTVWKDVAGVLNGDPRIEPQTVKLDELSYERAVEMTFYGATVIHPKTIKPIRNAGIPLMVKCFLDVDASGTLISSADRVVQNDKVCIRIQRKDQMLMRIVPKDFSFMDESHLGPIFQSLSRTGISVNLVQVAPIELTLCIQGSSNAVQEFESNLSESYQVSVEGGLMLKSFINPDKDAFEAIENACVAQFSGNKLVMVVRP